MLQITLFGGFRLAWNNQPLPSIPSHTARSLFAFLVCHPDQDHTRARLIGHFYPDLSEAKARRRLSQALWQIRHTLQTHAVEESVFLTDGDTVRWHDDMPYTLDVADFTAQLDAADQVDGAVRALINTLTAAADLYTGDLLEGLYDEWILPLRERLRARYDALLTELVQLHKSQGEYERSLHYARQSLYSNPLSEAGHRELMRLYQLLGRTNEALQQYDTLRDLLDAEFAAEPTDETRALYRQIAQQNHTPTTAPAPDSPSPAITTQQPPTPSAQSGLQPQRLVGRGRERQQLIALVEEALGGVGNAALIEGEPGIGKSRLLAGLADDATWRGLRVLRMQGHEVAQSTPFGAFREMLRHELSPLRIAQLAEMIDAVWLAEIATIVPAVAEQLPDLPPRAQLDDDQEQRRTEALRRLLQALGQLTPYLLLIDDLQWIDTSSLQMLQRLHPALAALPCSLCVAFRSEEARARAVVWELIRAIDLAAHSRRLQLTRLQVGEIEEILRHTFGAISDMAALADVLAQESGGNPLFLHETVRALVEQGYLRQGEDGAWQADLAQIGQQAAIAPTEQLRQVVAQRLAHLDEACQELLNTVAVFGGDFALSTLRAISPLSTLHAMTALERLTERNFVTATHGRYAISHDQIRQIVYDRLEEPLQRQVHGQIAEALVAEGTADAATLAYHFARGHRWPETVHHATRAGEEAAALAAYSASVEFYTDALTALEQTDHTVTQQFELLAARERALATLGEHEAQWTDIEQMAQLATTPAQKSLVYRRRTWAQIETAVDKAEAAARQALTLAQESQEKRAIAAASVALGTALDRRSNSAAAVPYLREAVALYQTLAEPEREAQARVELSNALTATADYNLALPELESAYQLYQRAQDRAGAARTLGRLGALQMEQGAAERAEACFAQALQIAREIGYRRVEASTLVNWANLHYAQNRIGDFLAYSEEAITLFAQMGRVHGVAFVQVNLASVRQGLLGEYERAQEEAAAALQHFRTVGDRGGEAQALEVLANIALAHGEFTDARQHVDAALVAVVEAGDRWLEVYVRAVDATLCLQQQQTQRGLAAIHSAEAICSEFGMNDQLIAVQSIRARLLQQDGRHDVAANLANQTLTTLLTTSIQQGHKVAYECYTTLDATGQRAEAATALAHAHTELERALAALTPEQRRTSLRRVPEHIAILHDWQATHAETHQVRLVRADVPTGRPVADDEWVDVSLTVSHPADQQVRSKKARRQQQLARILQEAAKQHAAPTIDVLATLLDAGKATIKRDLAELRTAGFTVKTRGSREG